MRKFEYLSNEIKCDFFFFFYSYEQAPNTIAYDFETIHNIDEWKCESALTVKEVLRYWNMSVQYWMATCVYKRIKWRQIAYEKFLFKNKIDHYLFLVNLLRCLFLLIGTVFI
jgi:hypothetical protein